MRKSRFLFGLITLLLGSLPTFGAPVQITMNSISETMSLALEDGTSVDVGEPQDRVYTFDVAPGKYILTGIGEDNVVNGTIELNVADQTEVQVFNIFTIQLYVTNANFSYGKDYTIDATVTSTNGDRHIVTIGECKTGANLRNSILAFSGNTVSVEYIPSEARKEEGYGSDIVSATITFNKPMDGYLQKVSSFVVTLPVDAGVELGLKRSHYTEFSKMTPESTEIQGDLKKITYHLTANTAYNVRTWRKNGLTYAYYFTMREGDSSIDFTEQTYTEYDPKQINHDPTSNQGYETGDIFVNINERGHLVMNVGDTFDAHAMRTWQLTDTQIDNYFFEPDFHYTVIGLDGKPSTGVIEVSTDDTTSPWRTIRAIGNGTAIVLVTYDAIKVSRPGQAQTWMGGEYWGAIWPENTAAYVVTVGENSTSIQPNMFLNEKYNINEDGTALLKLAGKYVDAEHDVFYYLDSEEGYNFTFKPEGVASVTLAYPTIGKNEATYTGFDSEGVSANEDGSYTLLLKHGRTIVKLTDATGKSVYQVLTAKSCHRVITNVSRDGDIFYAGDKVKIQYSGLFHPANKLSGIYNMSAYVTYNGIPNGTSLILGSGQYTFGSAPSAQAIEIEIPEDFSNTEYNMNDGVIQVTGYGDPIGNHRNIDKTVGRLPNFTAKAHKTYFGAIPDLTIPVSPLKHFVVKLNCNIDFATIILKKGDEVKEPVDKGIYNLVAGTYYIYAEAENYHCFRQEFELTDDMETTLEIQVKMEYAPDSWNGIDTAEPILVDNFYQISNGAELAWLVDHVNSRAEIQNAELTDDIDLGNHEWKAIGRILSRSYEGIFNGNGHKIYNLYTDEYQNYAGLFGSVGYKSTAEIKNLEVFGNINSESSYCGGIASYLINATVSNCASHVNINAADGNAGGISAHFGDNVKIINCYNTGNLWAKYSASGILPDNTEGLIIHNVLNIGKIKADSDFGPCALDFWDPWGDGGVSGEFSNLFAAEDTDNNWIDGQFGIDGTEIVSAERMASGEIAYRLGKAFGQNIGEDEYPVLYGPMVYRVNYIIINDAQEISTPSDDSSLIYTNGSLPNELNGEEAHWFIDEDMTQPVSTVESDSALFVRLGSTSGIIDISTETGINENWFNIQGVEVPEPNVGTHGIFIRVVNGKSEKVVL